MAVRKVKQGAVVAHRRPPAFAHLEQRSLILPGEMFEQVFTTPPRGGEMKEAGGGRGHFCFGGARGPFRDPVPVFPLGFDELRTFGLEDSPGKKQK